MGQVIGVAAGGVEFQNQKKSNLAKYPNLAPEANTYSQATAAALVEIIKAY